MHYHDIAITNKLSKNKKNLDKVLPVDDGWGAEQNLFGFFRLLLEVDQRINPEFYKKLAEKQRKEKICSQKKQ